MIDLFLEIKPQPKQRPVFCKKTGCVFTPKETRKSENAIGLLVKSYMYKHGIERSDKLISIKIRFHFVDKDPDRVKREPIDYYSQRPDIDNMAKLVLDALNKIAYTDDKLVVQLFCEKVYSDKEGIHLKIKEL